MLQIKKFEFNEFRENTYLIYDESREAAIIDPGCRHPYEQDELSGFIEENNLKPILLLNTHCHIDHILGNDFVIDKYGLPLHLHEGELFTYADANRWTSMFGIPPITIPEKKVFLEPGNTVSIGNTPLRILFTPGHSIASVSFLDEKGGNIFSGDVLFFSGIGRTDLPGGNFNRLMETIQNQFFTLPENTTVYSGHGQETTIVREKKTESLC